MHMIFTGPAGAPFLNREIDAVTIHGASLEDLAALQRGTQLKMPQIMERLQSVQEALKSDEADAGGDGQPSTTIEPEDPYNDLADASAGANEMFNMQVMVFLALRTAGYRIHWRVARDMKFGDFEVFRDADPDEDEVDETAAVEAVDPPVTSTASAPASVAVVPPTPTAATAISPQ